MFPSWTDVNDESRQEIEAQTVVPVAKGVRSSPCLGEILSMHGKYGWIKPLQPIEHKDVHKHEGRIYLKARDMRRGEVPKAKSLVEFFLYADRDGLGAEDCHVVHEAENQQESACATWQKPWQQKWEKKSWQKWEKPWNSCAKGKHSSWKSSPASRPEPLVMVRPEQLLLQRGTAASTRLVSASSFWCPEKPWTGDACVSEDDSNDSTSAGDSASDVCDEPEAFLSPPPGLEIQPWMVPPPPGLELLA
jgi:hypothetical protein